VTTGFVFSERYLWHETGSWGETSPWLQPSLSPEGPEPKRRIRNLLELSGLLDRLTAIAPRAATRAEVERFHRPAYVERIIAQSAGVGGNAGGFTPFAHGAYEIALLAAGGVISAVDAVLDGAVANAYALVRPPGHHASPETGDGFCLFNNIGVAIQHARHARGLRRIAVVDFDVHHGNGTETGFYEDAEVLTISVHQDGWYPAGRGSRDDNGAGPGAGANINIPLPAGSGAEAYELAFERVVEPALHRFAPELIFIACGLDANSYDPFGRMLLDSEAFRSFAARIRRVADALCDGRLVVAHEGGYSAEVVPFCALAVIEAMSGLSSGVEDPFLAANRASPGQELLPHQASAVAAAAELVTRVPRSAR
jgi:acetoin utilization deacetylase AcuC-like enzyme